MSDRDIQIIIQAIDKTGSAIASIDKNLGWLGGSITKVAVQFSAMSTGIQMAWNVIGKAFEQFKIGAKEEQIEEAFRSVEASAGESADKILAAMTKASAGTIEDSDLMQKAVKGITQGLKGNDLIQIAEAARVAVRTSGKDITTAFDEIVDAVANKYPRALQGMGLVTKEQMLLYDKAIRTGADGVNLLDIVVANTVKHHEQFGGVISNNTERIQTFSATCKNAGSAISKFFSQIFDEAWTKMAKTQAMNEQVFEKLGRPAKSKEEYEATKRALIDLGDAGDYAQRHLFTGDKQAKKATDAWQAIIDKSNMENKIKALSESWTQTKIGLEGDISTSGLSDFAKSVGEIEKKADELKNKFGKISGAKGLITLWQSGKENDLVQKAEKEGSKALADYERSMTETQASELDKRLVQVDSWALKERELLNAARKGGLVDEEVYQLEIQRIIAASEKEKGKIQLAVLNTNREAEIQGRLSEINMLEKSRGISESEAIEQKITLNQELLSVQEEYQTSLDKTKDPASWYAQTNAIAQTRDKLIELRESAKEYGTAWDGIIEGIRKYLVEQKKTFKAGEEMAKQVTSGMESAFTGFFDTTSQKFMDFGELAKNILNSIYMAIVQNLIVKQLVAGIMGGIFHEGGVVMHQGGLVMHEGGYVPRYHMGTLAADERPAILQTGEGVLSRRGMANLGALNSGMGGGGNVDLKVEVINQSSVPVQGKQGPMRFDGKQIVTSIILSDLDSYGPIRNAFQGIK